MGKRKLHDNTYFQCDWTGLPMRTSLCYMPVFRESGKMTKQGSYVCWEAVIAHAREMCNSDIIDTTALNKIELHVDTIVGCHVHAAPHWSALQWFDQNGTLDSKLFFDRCEALDNGQKTMVHITSDGGVEEIFADPTDFRLKFGTFLGVRPDDVHTFVSTRKKSRDREVVVFHTGDDRKPVNEKASTIFKMKIHGDVIVAQKTKETCYWNRFRYTDYTADKLTEKRKREDCSGGMSKQDYAGVRSEMEQEFSAFEGVASSLSELPSDLARASGIVPPDAKELAALAQARKLARLEERLGNALVPVEACA